MSSTKIFHCRPSKHFPYQISLLCDGKFTAKPSQCCKNALRQLIVAYLLKTKHHICFVELLMDTANLYSTIDSLKYLQQQQYSRNMNSTATAQDTWYGNNSTNRFIVSASGVEVNRIYGLKTTLGNSAKSEQNSTLGYYTNTDQQSTLGFNTVLMSSDGGYLRFVPTDPQGQNSGSFLKTSQYKYRVYDSRQNSVESRQNSVQEENASINTADSAEKYDVVKVDLVVKS